MSLAWYITRERSIPGLDHFVNGKALAHAQELLDRLAQTLGVHPLMYFFSASPEELAGVAEDHGLDFQEDGVSLPAENWFSAEDGLNTVCALMKAVAEIKDERADRILRDLDEFDKVLKVARDNGVNWHLAIDY